MRLLLQVALCPFPFSARYAETNPTANTMASTAVTDALASSKEAFGKKLRTLAFVSCPHTSRHVNNSCSRISLRNTRITP